MTEPTTSAVLSGTVGGVVGDPLAGCRRRLVEFLASHGGRCTRNQWIAETCLIKKSIADQLTTEMVRKTKTHCISNAPLERLRERKD